MVESVMMIVASLVPNFLMGLIAGAGVLVSVNVYIHPHILDMPLPSLRICRGL